MFELPKIWTTGLRSRGPRPRNGASASQSGSMAVGVCLCVALTLGAAPLRAEISIPATALGARAAESERAARPGDETRLVEALQAARSRRLDAARTLQAQLSDPIARKLVDWALLDVYGEALGAPEVKRGHGDLRGWPREEGRSAALKRLQVAATPAAPLPYAPLAATRSASGGSWTQRRLLMNQALRVGDPRAAYAAAAAHGLPPGGLDFAEAESFAGWLALNKLGDSKAAEVHFARLAAAVRTPVSKARAAYWRGRTAEAQGDEVRAKLFYEEGAQHTTTFYGQLSAERAGITQLSLVKDPTPDLYDRAGLEAHEVMRALRLLSQAGERGLAKVFALHLGDTVATTTDLAALMDAIQGLGEPEFALLAYRRAAQRGLILHERGYPVVPPPQVLSGAEPALVLAIVRQESQFDPRVRSSADARGMMQILPGTGREMAQKVGMAWNEALLWDPHINMHLGSRYLGHLTSHFEGSYVLAAAGYNAGPSRPRQWVGFCGDPRSGSVDPLDFLECIPFSETRTYVMNVMANLQVYRARLNGGQAPLTLASELRRGAAQQIVTYDSPSLSAVGGGS